MLFSGSPLLGEQREKAPVGLFLEAKSQAQGVREASYACDNERKERSDGIASLRASYVAGRVSERKGKSCVFAKRYPKDREK